MNSKGILFVITGPSGVGKGTVLSQVFATTDNLFYSLSVTTRPPRHGEKHGVNYLFYEYNQVKTMIENDELLEYAEYVDNIYGTPAGPVEHNLAQGKDVVLEIEVLGALMIKRRCPDAVLVFIAPPGFDELEQRLRSRGSDNESAICKRLEKAREEYRKIDEFNYVVVNDNVSDAADKVRAIIMASRCLTLRRTDGLFEAETK